MAIRNILYKSSGKVVISMPKKTIAIGCSLLAAIMICLTACGSSLKLPDDPIVFEVNYDNDVTLVWNNREYVSCGTFTGTKIIGKCLGYYTDKTNSKIYVCQLKGQSEEEWLIDTIALDGSNEGSIYKEKNVISIPGEIKEYMEER